ncbi:MAG: S-layer homology domain-containing protein, partial [Pseudoflavonifractor sp.]
GGDSNPKTIQFTITKAAATENLTDAPAINYTAETVATTTDMQWYKNLSWVDCTAAMSPADFGWNGSTLLQVTFRAKNDNNHNPSTQEQILSLPARPAAPEIGSFTVGKPTQGGNDGTLSGITSAMEYSTDSGASWKDGTDAQLTAIPDGTVYTIRAKATGSTFAGNTVSVTVASKEAATITFADGTAVYNGAAQAHKSATASAAGDITYTYAAEVGSALTEGKPQDAGSYTVTATLDTITHYGTKTVNFIITKKPVTVKADDKSMTAGGSLPAFTVTYTGFVGTENENNAALTTPALASCAADGNAAGAFDILLSTPAVLNDTVGKNYTITSQTKGTLTVSSPYSDDDIPPLVTEIKTGGSITGGNLDRLIAGKKDLTVTGAGGAKLVFDTDALRGINDRTSGRISVEIKDVSAEHQDTHKGKTLFSLTVTSGGKIVSDFGGKVTVTLPYTLKDGEKAEDVTVWHLAEDGSLTEIPATYDPKTGLATFTVSHFSKYVVGVNAKWSNPFTDVGEKDWYYDAVKYTHQNGLFSGTSATGFAPADKMNRAMLWTVLARQAGQDMTGGSYEKARAWAVEKGISDGTNPTGNITREQLVTMLWRQAGSPVLMDYPGLSRFTDAGDVSAFARQAMAWAHQKGLVQGSGNALSPKQSATRAEVAAIMMRYCRSAAK